MGFDIAITVERGGTARRYHVTSPAGLTALFGPSGAGKTTLLDAIAGLVPVQSGHIIVGGHVLFEKAPDARKPAVALKPEQRRCGYVFQDLRLFPHRSVQDNLRYGTHAAPNAHPALAWEPIIDMLGIAHLLKRMPATLSGGEAQRVAIGRALLSQPRCLLFDEPLAAVDQARREEILRLIERIRDTLDLPILYVSHDRSEVERLAHKIIPIG